MKNSNILTILFTLILLTLSPMLFSQSWQWGKQGGGIDALTFVPEGIKKMATDLFGNVYGVTTVSKTNLLIDGNPQTAYGQSGQISNGCLVSFDCNGSYRWSKVIGYIGRAQVFDVKTDAVGNVYIIGVLDPSGAGFNPEGYNIHYDVDLLVPQCSNDGVNCQRGFIVKYTNNGTLLWVKHIENDILGFNYDVDRAYPQTMSIDAQGNMGIFCALYPGTFFNGAYTNTFPNRSYHLLLLDHNGNFVSGHRIDLDPNGYNPPIYSYDRNAVTGDYYIGCIYSNGNGTAPPGPIIGGIQVTKPVFLAAFNAQGTLLWYHQNTVFGFLGSLVDIYADATDNTLYVTGRIVGTGRTNPETAAGDTFAGVTFPVDPDAPGPGSFDTFVMKLNANGGVIWSSNASRSSGLGNGITLNGNEVAIGSYIYIVRWQGETNEPPANGILAVNAGIVRLNKDTGTIIKITNTLVVESESVDEYAVVADHVGNYYLGGSFKESLFAGSSTLLNNGAQTDFFIAKYGTNNCDCQVPTCKFRAFGAGTLNNIYFKYQGQPVFDSVLWTFGDGNSSTEINPTHVYANPGVYNVCLTATNACDSYNYCQTINTTTLKNVGFNLDKNERFVIYPNPAENTTFVQYETATTEALLEVYDITGRLVARELTNTKKGRWQLDTSAFAKGSYIVTLKENNLVVGQKKLVKK
jgi:hypothetical protein